MSTLFLTGGSGFVGSRLFEALRRRGDSLIALDRSGSLRARIRRADLPGLDLVQADILQPLAYERALANADVVLHFAGLTGRASREDHLQVNARGTEVLVDQCRRLGVPKFLFASSIAAKFPNQREYHYAQSKVRAEEAVRKSGLDFTIIRPAIILGHGSPILAALEKLASLPVIPIFGNGRAMVQPIYVDDLVEYVLMILEQNLFQGHTLDLGGPAALTIEELLQKIRHARKGARAYCMHVPMAPLLALLRCAQAVGLGGLLPLTVGQLSSFRYDGTIEPNPLYETRHASLLDVPQMLSLTFNSYAN
jgi:NADH dehydrogenase